MKKLKSQSGRAWLLVLASSVSLAACAPADSGGTGGSADADLSGETGGADASGSTGGNVTGGTTPDAAQVQPDAANPDAAVVPPDAAVVQPDGAVIEPDAAQVQPDAAVGPDAAVIEPDAFVVGPDAGPPVVACLPENILDFNALAQADANGLYADTTLVAGDSVLVGTCGGDGSERVFHFVAPDAGNWHLTTESIDEGAIDTILYARSACNNAATEIDCNDEGGTPPGSALNLDLQANQEVFLVVDGYTPNAVGNVRLRAIQGQIVNAGEICDPNGAPRACADGLICDSNADPHVCLSQTAPTVTTGELFWNPALGAVVVRIEGADPEDNVNGIRADFRDGAGDSVFLGVGPATVTNNAGQYVAVAAAQVGHGAIPTQATVTAVDSTFLNSDPFPIGRIENVPTIARGAACDQAGLLDNCADGLGCSNVAGPNFGTCQAAEAQACDIAGELSGSAPDDTGLYLLAGDNTGAANNSAPTCQPTTSGELLYTFTAPQDGTYEFHVDPTVGASPLQDSVLSIRAGCSAASRALACNDDVGGGSFASTVTTNVTAGTTVYLQVEGFADSVGTFQLTARRTGELAAPPILESAQVLFDAPSGASRIVLTGSAGAADVTGLEIDLNSAARPVAIGLSTPINPSAVAGQAFAETVDPAIGFLKLAPFADSAAVRVVAEDGSSSGTVETPIVLNAAPALELGAICGGSVFDTGTCPEGTFCGDGDADPATPDTCVDNNAACPDAWGVQDLPVGGLPLQIPGNLAQAVPVPGYSCAGSSDNAQVFRFTAGAAGTYQFEVVVPNADTVLTIRSACLNPGSEIACNDDIGGGNLASRAAVALEAGQAVFVGVSGFSAAVNAAYTLSISQLN